MLHANNVKSLYADDEVMRLMVSLDAIMDLRLAAMMILHPEFAFLASTDQNYYTRKVDIYENKELGSVDRQRVFNICDKFKPEIIQAAEYTRLLEVLQDFILAYFKKSITGPAPDSLEITINLEGYPFTDEQVKDIGETIYNICNKLSVSVSFISIPLDKLKIEELDTQYDVYYIYNWDVFHNTNSQVLKNRKYKNVRLYAPKVLFGRMPSEQEYKNFIEVRADLYKAMCIELSPYITIEFLPVEYYCAMTPVNTRAFDAYVSNKK